MGGPQSWSGRFRGKDNLFSLPGREHDSCVHPVDPSLYREVVVMVVVVVVVVVVVEVDVVVVFVVLVKNGRGIMIMEGEGERGEAQQDQRSSNRRASFMWSACRVIVFSLCVP